ncbi:MAG: archaemetzincin family Zn-dependent metalloprotease [Deltaproteobacteria bacterium]|nr:archaemetzincin family Zn-dependent metalloprotease [Deltaproteobacteria bacterium]
MTALWLVPFELHDPPGLLPWLGHRLEPTFRVQARVLEGPLDVAACLDKRRGQYDTRALLTRLLELPEQGLILGVTSADLFLSIFTFVIGEACLGGRAAVVSTYRLHEERYGLPPDPDRMRDRLVKEAVHELGHCHGLVHCGDSRCVMHASSAAEDVDLKGYELCSTCHRSVANARGRG